MRASQSDTPISVDLLSVRLKLQVTLVHPYVCRSDHSAAADNEFFLFVWIVYEIKRRVANRFNSDEFVARMTARLKPESLPDCLSKVRRRRRRRSMEMTARAEITVLRGNRSWLSTSSLTGRSSLLLLPARCR